MKPRLIVLKSICAAAAIIDKLLSRYGCSFMSNEGKIFCNAVMKEGDMVKNITGHPEVSPRSASMAFNKLYESKIIIKKKSDKDMRSFNVYVNYEFFDELDMKVHYEDFIANDNILDKKITS